MADRRRRRSSDPEEWTAEDWEAFDKKVRQAAQTL